MHQIQISSLSVLRTSWKFKFVYVRKPVVFKGIFLEKHENNKTLTKNIYVKIIRECRHANLIRKISFVNHV